MAVVPGMNLVGEGVPELGVTKPHPLDGLVGVQGAGAAGAAEAGVGCVWSLALGAALGAVAD